MKRISRRSILRGLALAPGAMIYIACSNDSPLSNVVDVVGPEPRAEAPTATPEPFVLAAGEQRRMLMDGTPQATPLHIYGSGRPGPIVMALGGVHGNEPGGWLATERIQQLRPATGALLLVPRANRVATNLFERTTTDLGDLNRLYPGDPNGLPMARMASEIMDTLREFHVGTLIDMHESWAFYYNRPQNGTAFLGQTVSTFAGEPSVALVKGVVEAVNQRVQAPWEEFYYRDSPNRAPGSTTTPSSAPGQITPGPTNGISTSSLGIPRYIPGLTVLLVEMGQQQALERRIALHVDVFKETLHQVGGQLA